MVGIIIETQDTAKSVAKNIPETSIPPKKGCAWGGETKQQQQQKKEKKKKQAKKKTDSTVTKNVAK